MKSYHLPSPNPAAYARSQALTSIIASEIEQIGSMPFTRFMELALYHPELGYYRSATMRFGKEGDFTTASEISPLYAHCFARQCAGLYEAIGTDNVLELGAGSGKFAMNFLAHAPGHYYIYEPSASLRQQQHQLIASTRPDFIPRITWLSELPATFTGIIIANEVLDAIPFHCFQIANGLPCERTVAWHNDFIWQNTAITSEHLLNEVTALQKQYQLAEGYQSEINLLASECTIKLCKMLARGVILFADYGYGQFEYYHPARTQGSLSCFYQHQTHNQPLLYPGLQDITAHVDFTRIIATAAEHGGHLLGYTTQSAFLLANGLLQMAEQLETNMDEASAFNLHQEIKLLTMPMEMGDLVKIMAIGRQMDTRLPEFTRLDRRRDL